MVSHFQKTHTVDVVCARPGPKAETERRQDAAACVSLLQTTISKTADGSACALPPTHPSGEPDGEGRAF
jgi:hypothetical protein